MILYILIGSCLAFGLEVSEYFAVYKTSSITLSVVGIIKVSIICFIIFLFFINFNCIIYQEICILILAVEWSGDKMNSTKYLGLALCMIGVFGHVLQKYKNSKSNKNRYGVIGDDNKHLTLPESDSDDSEDSNSSNEVLFDILNRRNS